PLVRILSFLHFFVTAPATTEIYTLSLHDALPISRRGFAIQRLMNAMRQAHADGWFIVFDTLTLADDRLEAFYDNPNALRDHFRRSEERFSRNAETDIVCRLLLEKQTLLAEVDVLH